MEKTEVLEQRAGHNTNVFFYLSVCPYNFISLTAVILHTCNANEKRHITRNLAVLSQSCDGGFSLKHKTNRS